MTIQIHIQMESSSQAYGFFCTGVARFLQKQPLIPRSGFTKLKATPPSSEENSKSLSLLRPPYLKSSSSFFCNFLYPSYVASKPISPCYPPRVSQPNSQCFSGRGAIGPSQFTWVPEGGATTAIVKLELWWKAKDSRYRCRLLCSTASTAGFF